MKHHYDTVDAEELPIVLEDGGPTAGDKHVEIVEGECGNCKYDRLKVERQFGECVETCMLCDYSRFGDGSWEPPSTNRRRLNKAQEYAAEESNDYSKVGEIRNEIGPDLKVFDSTYGFEIFMIFDGNVERSLFQSEHFEEIVALLEAEQEFVTDVVSEHVDDKAVTNEVNAPNNPEAIHIGVWEHKYDDRPTGIRLVNTIRHDDRLWSLAPIHLDPEADGIVP